MKKVRLPLYQVAHVVSSVFDGVCSRYYRDTDNNLTFVVNRDGNDWKMIFPSADVLDVEGATVMWIVFQKNTNHCYYEVIA